MTEFPILRDLAYVVVGASALLVLRRWIPIPAIVAYIVTGLALGPGLGLLEATGSLALLSEVGIALLLFLVGLELSLGVIRDLGRPAVLGGCLQVLLTVVLGAGVATLLGFGPIPALFLGLVTAFSSTVVVVKLLDEGGDLSALHGRLAVGVLIVQDVLVAVVLTLLSGLAGEAAVAHGSPTSASGTEDIAMGLARSFSGMVALALVGGAAVRWILPRFFEWLAGSGEAHFVASLAWCFAFILAAESLHISVELGAFIAGVSLAQLPHSGELRRRVHPLVDFFLAVFFVTLGASLNLEGVEPHIPAVATLSALVLVGKPILTALILGFLGRARRTAFLTGLTLGQVSEFAFILTGLGVGAGLIPASILSLVGAVGLITMAASSFLVPWGPRLFRALSGTRLTGWMPGRPEEEEPEEARRGHVVVVGMNNLGRTLVGRLRERGARVLAVDTDPAKLRGLGTETFLGNISDPSAVEETGLARAALVVSALQIEDVNRLLSWRCRALGVPVSAHAWDPTVADELLEDGADHVVVSKLAGLRPLNRRLRALGLPI